MAGAVRDIVDPVEAAEHGIGRSRQLIAATLDDLTLHHSWLETYHREERLRAERLRRREAMEKLELRRQQALRAVRRFARAAATASRLTAAFAAETSRTFGRWAAPRADKAARRTSAELSLAWAWSRQNGPRLARRGFAATQAGLNWSVHASDEAGVAFRRRASEISAALAEKAVRRSAPARRRAAIGWVRTRRTVGRRSAALRTRLAEFARRTPAIAASQRTAWRASVHAMRAGTRAMRNAERIATVLERHVTESVIRTAPELRRRLSMYTPDRVLMPRPGRALIVRPVTALACVAPVRRGLPVPVACQDMRAG